MEPVTPQNKDSDPDLLSYWTKLCSPPVQTHLLNLLNEPPRSWSPEATHTVFLFKEASSYLLPNAFIEQISFKPTWIPDTENSSKVTHMISGERHGNMSLEDSPDKVPKEPF